MYPIVVILNEHQDCPYLHLRPLSLRIRRRSWPLVIESLY